MKEEEIRAEIKRRKEIFRQEQATLSFGEKVCIAFALNEGQETLKRARLIQGKETDLQTSTGSAERRSKEQE